MGKKAVVVEYINEYGQLRTRLVPQAQATKIIGGYEGSLELPAKDQARRQVEKQYSFDNRRN